MVPPLEAVSELTSVLVPPLEAVSELTSVLLEAGSELTSLHDAQVPPLESEPIHSELPLVLQLLASVPPMSAQPEAQHSA